MWGLIVAAFLGVFGSMFNTAPSAGMSRYDDAPKYREEYQYSHFDNGFQTNDESGTNETAGNDLQSSSDERKVSGVYIPPKTDVTAARDPENGKNGYDSLTVLSGD